MVTLVRDLARRRSVRIAFSGLVVLWMFASFLVHPLSHRVSDRAGAPLFPGSDVAPAVISAFSHACINCHSEKTRWSWYSQIAPASWLVERDVKRARERMNVSYWDAIETVDKRLLLTAIATVIEKHQMPPRRYTILHPEEKLFPDEAVEIIEWTRRERRRLREMLIASPSK